MSASISGLTSAGHKIEDITVRISNDVIQLLSESLYRSPHKAIEELVSNAYDADAQQAHVLLPERDGDNGAHRAPLWVIDNGHGMDVEGFHQLWRIADSPKINSSSPKGRSPIGKFGIGKLAAYVLAWKLTYLSCVDGRLLLAMMDFRSVTKSQNAAAPPVQISLREIDESAARKHVAEIRQRDPEAWTLMFDNRKRAPS